jgi:hypothetical protein
MLANCAVIAAVLLFLAVMLMAEQLAFLRDSARVVLAHYAWTLAGILLVVYVNLFALIFAIARRLLLKDTGRKLAHVERQLRTSHTIVRDLSERLSRED